MKTQETAHTASTRRGAVAPSRDFTPDQLRDLIVGGRVLVPTIDGTMRPYINLDSAASTPIARPIKEKVDEFYEWYSAVHRGAGFKSQVASLAYEHARDLVAAFVGADLSDRCLVFVRNTTEALNRCAGLMPVEEGTVILTTLMEHHSNILTWRKHYVHVEAVSIDEHGAPLLSDLEARLKANHGQVKLVAISGGSNVTGVIPDLHHIARMVHAAGAMLLVDAAQLAPHRPIDMGPLGAPESIDFLAMSAHKMYAPLGTGVLIGPQSIFDGHAPELVGGGTVLFVSEESVIWTSAPDSEEAGSPNVVGAIAMAAATRFLSEHLTWEWIVAHERDLTSYALRKLNEIPGLVIFGQRDPALPEDRLGVIAFNLEKVNHWLTAAILSHEYGIGTRTGCFCAHPYIMRLLKLDPEYVQEIVHQVTCGDRRGMPGAVRVSFGFYNSREDVDAVVSALWDIHNGNYRGDYVQDIRSGEFRPTSSKTAPAGWFEI